MVESEHWKAQSALAVKHPSVEKSYPYPIRLKKKVTTRGNRAINNRKFLHECRRCRRRCRYHSRAVTVKYVWNFNTLRGLERAHARAKVNFLIYRSTYSGGLSDAPDGNIRLLRSSSLPLAHSLTRVRNVFGRSMPLLGEKSGFIEHILVVYEVGREAREARRK